MILLGRHECLWVTLIADRRGNHLREAHRAAAAALTASQPLYNDEP
jgi:hypothetical protein